MFGGETRIVPFTTVGRVRTIAALCNGVIGGPNHNGVTERVSIEGEGSRRPDVDRQHAAKQVFMTRVANVIWRVYGWDGMTRLALLRAGTGTVRSGQYITPVTDQDQALCWGHGAVCCLASCQLRAPGLGT